MVCDGIDDVEIEVITWDGVRGEPVPDTLQYRITNRPIESIVNHSSTNP